ncbi:unnamed protein product [Acanthoscelides obtectus]|uniref:Uncharacterized protein n=1 Tax=Acanthoscelides obtectus TaxID=200917 RepID=A0A9P0PYE9_ACAOB|nr:unnamed protein product [Acanthoscelides obtectus]CAK1632700.1 hypothetical protein AOBTE_LOCUS7688 [Acanthoscelides obtectus]
MHPRFKRFSEFQTFFNIKPHKLLHSSQTRWLSLISAEEMSGKDIRNEIHWLEETSGGSRKYFWRVGDLRTSRTQDNSPCRRHP